MATETPEEPTRSEIVSGPTAPGQPDWIRMASVIKSSSADPQDCYPKSDTYTFGEFAYLVVEAGGYGDLTAINPYTGKRFWSPVFPMRGASGDEPDRLSAYDGLRRLVDAMEAHAFLSSDGAESIDVVAALAADDE